MLSPGLESHYYKHKNNPKCREQVTDLTNELSLVTRWKAVNARGKRFTWRRSQPVHNKVIWDCFFLINENLVAEVISADIEPAYGPDHSAIKLHSDLLEELEVEHSGKFQAC